MSLRIYLVVGLFVGGLTFLVSTFFGADIVIWAQEQQIQASLRGLRVLELVVFEPLIFVLGTRPFGPIVAGLAWPLVFVWFFLILISLVIIAAVDYTASVDL